MISINRIEASIGLARLLSKGTYGARVKIVTVSPDDIDLDFDTKIEAHDLDTFVPASFARVGDTVRARVINIKTGVTVAASSRTCVAK